MFVRDGLQRGDAVTPASWRVVALRVGDVWRVLCEPPDRRRGNFWIWSLSVGVARGRAGEALFWANFAFLTCAGRC